MSKEAREAIANGIDAVEEAYEFFLAYAAQGITAESESSKVGGQVRVHLEKMGTALSELGPNLRALLAEDGSDSGGQLDAFRSVVEADAQKAAAVLSLIRSQQAITSQLIDNLNASVHVRTLLTDLFILDEVLKLGVDKGTTPETAESAT